VQARLVWLPSGEEVEFRVIWPDFFLYWLGKLDQRNMFGQTAPSKVQAARSSLAEHIRAIQNISASIPELITTWPDDLFDQRALNQLHRDWVIAGQRFPKLPLLLERMGLEPHWRGINDDIHRLESAFEWQYKNYDLHPWQVPNTFGSAILDHSTANIMLGFDNLGRSSWEKFCNYDTDGIDVDTNNFEMLSGKLEISLNRPLSLTMPENYQNWCALHKVPVVGRHLRIGNFADDHATLNQLRYLFVNNENEPGHKIFFAL